MSAYKRTVGYVATGLLALTLSFGAANDSHAQSKDKRLAFNGISGKADVEAIAKATMNAPVVKMGTAGDATLASYNDRLAIHIIGKKGSQMTPEEYAKDIAGAFADRENTNKPIYITVTYENSDQPGKTIAAIYMDGIRYKTKKGYNTFTPEQIESGVQSLTDVYVARHGDKHILKEGVKTASLTSLRKDYE